MRAKMSSLKSYQKHGTAIYAPLRQDSFHLNTGLVNSNISTTLRRTRYKGLLAAMCAFMYSIGHCSVLTDKFCVTLRQKLRQGQKKQPEKLH